MRIIWNIEENWFQAELTPGDNWRDDMESVKKAGFKTTGEPLWLLHASKASALNKLRDGKPKSGLVITEVALANYKLLNDQETKKQELKKLFEKGKVAARRDFAGSKTKEYEENGLTSFVVEQKDSGFVSKYVKPTPPKENCLVCEDPLYFYEYNNICIWCKIELDNGT